ncbi:hypothetical protein OF83DRAFT_1044715, partial [Amylostereum chailletii]
RPPNAFMLFRSDLLRKGVIPSSETRKQQDLSKVAGQIWNMMPVDEKKKWQDRGREALLAHAAANPGYKF